MTLANYELFLSSDNIFQSFKLAYMTFYPKHCQYKGHISHRMATIFQF